MRQYFITTILLSLSTICFAQQHTIVFDQQGRIVKNYGFEKSDKYDLEYKFLIEGVTSADSNSYFLIYQWRNDYLYEANNTFENNTVSQIRGFDSGGYLKISYPEKKTDKKFVKKTNENSRLLSYQLIRVNECGKKLLSLEKKPKGDSPNKKQFKKKNDETSSVPKKDKDSLKTKETNIHEMTLNSLEAQCIKKSLVIDSIPSEILLDSLEKKIDSLRIIEDDLRKLEGQKKDKTFSSDYSNILRDKSLYEKKLEIRKQQLDKLGSGKNKCCTGDYIEEVTSKIIAFTDSLHIKQVEIDSLQKDHEDKIKKTKSKVGELKKSIEKKITGSLKIDLSPIYTLLHQGVLVSKDKNRSEIVYDVKKQKLFDSDKDILNVARLTPDLPQLTTESQLYLHVLNLRPSDFKQNPFAISLSSSLSEEVAIESPANFQGLQNVDLGLESFSNLIIETEKKVDKAVEDITKKEVPIFVIEKKKIVQYIVMLIKSNLKKDPNYIDYLLKYPRPFEAKKKPRISLKALQPEVENFKQEVEGATVKNESYEIKYVTKTLVADTLPPVHRFYRFALNTGLVTSQNISYSYQRIPLPNSSVDQLKEVREVTQHFRPLLTLSTYLQKQDLAVDPNLTGHWWNSIVKELWKTAHIDIGLDYAQKNVFDDVYLGIGFEPKRLIHLAFGAKISEVDRVDSDKLDPVTLDISSAMTSETKIRLYFSVNLGLNFIPTAISALIK